MVSYQKFVSLVYQQTPDEALASPDENQQLMASIGAFWSENKEELSTATVSEARNIIDRNLNL